MSTKDPAIGELTGVISSRFDGTLTRSQRELGELTTVCELFGVSSSKPVQVKYSLHAFAEHGGLIHPDKSGWGIAYHEGKDALLLKEPEPDRRSRRPPCGCAPAWASPRTRRPGRWDSPHRSPFRAGAGRRSATRGSVTRPWRCRRPPSIPKWKRNVRNVLQYRKNNKGLIWDGSANYRLDNKGRNKFNKYTIRKANIEIDLKHDYDHFLSSIEETERQAIISQRIGQQIIRKHLLSLYENKCAMCSIDHPDLLRVSHIIPWSENIDTRLNIQNTLLLCGLHDVAFKKDIS